MYVNTFLPYPTFGMLETAQNYSNIDLILNVLVKEKGQRKLDVSLMATNPKFCSLIM